MIETTACDPLHLVAVAVIGTIKFVSEVVVSGGSVASAAVIAISIRLYFIGSTYLASFSCLGNEFASVASVAPEPYMTQT